MPRRQPLTQALRAATAALAIAALTGCAQLQVDTYPTTAGSQERCEELLHDLPGAVGDLGIRLVKDTVAGAWGDPPVVLRCGVEPASASLPCRTVGQEHWREDTTADGLLFTSLDRPTRVSVEVPSAYRPSTVFPALQPTLDKHDAIKGDPSACPR